MRHIEADRRRGRREEVAGIGEGCGGGGAHREDDHEVSARPAGGTVPDARVEVVVLTRLRALRGRSAVVTVADPEARRLPVPSRTVRESKFRVGAGWPESVDETVERVDGARPAPGEQAPTM